MELSTKVQLPKFDFEINHAQKLVTLGSCFSENIGLRLAENKFQTLINPFGQQYNPASMVNGLNRILQQTFFTDNDLIFHNELYHSWQHHSDFSKPNKEELLDSINQSLAENLNQLKQADFLFLTFGTSHVFEWKNDGRIVSNCHKMSGSAFNFRFLSPQEIFDFLNTSLNDFKKINSTAKIILTISPVRYLAFGFYENNLSKANLFVAIEMLLKHRNDCFYFPAFEIVMDELRDYRFFTEDMLHPNRLATNYVWEKMCECMMSDATIKLMHEIGKINAAVNHKPRNANSVAHKKFIATTLKKIEEMETLYPSMDWQKEKSILQKES